MICFYHSRDLDGFCSGAIVKHKFPNCELIGYDYGQPFPFEKCVDQDVIMVDVSLPMIDMKTLYLTAKSFLWIDHHIGAINDYEKIDLKFNAVLDNTIAACEITWKHFFPGDSMPIAIKLLGEYDTWRYNDYPAPQKEAVLNFQYGMRLECISPETFYNDYFLYYPSILDSTIEIGKAIRKYQRQLDERACKGAFEVQFEGYRAICLNKGLSASTTFESVYDETKHDLMIPFYFNGKEWIYSLYTTKDINCVQLAKKYGGGGHLKAAGFQTKTLLKEIQNVQSK